MKAYFYCTDGTTASGPVSIDELIRLRFSGNIGDMAQVCEQGSEVWMSLETILLAHKQQEYAKKFASPVSAPTKNRKTIHSILQTNETKKNKPKDTPIMSNRSSNQNATKIPLAATNWLLSIIAGCLIYQTTQTMRSNNVVVVKNPITIDKINDTVEAKLVGPIYKQTDEYKDGVGVYILNKN